MDKFETISIAIMMALLGFIAVIGSFEKYKDVFKIFMFRSMLFWANKAGGHQNTISKIDRIIFRIIGVSLILIASWIMFNCLFLQHNGTLNFSH